MHSSSSTHGAPCSNTHPSHPGNTCTAPKPSSLFSKCSDSWHAVPSIVPGRTCYHTASAMSHDLSDWSYVCAQVEECAQGWLPLDKLGQAGAQHAPQPALALPEMPVMLHSPYIFTLVNRHVLPGLYSKTNLLSFRTCIHLSLSALVSCDIEDIRRQHCAEPSDNNQS